jgi:hypothetical protein
MADPKPLAECREDDLANHHALVFGRTLCWTKLGERHVSYWSKYAWWKAMWYPHRGPPTSSAAWGVYSGPGENSWPGDADLSFFLPIPDVPAGFIPANCVKCGRQLRLDGLCVECDFSHGASRDE